MKRKIVIPAILSASALMAAITPAMVSAATERIPKPTDSATLVSNTYTELYNILNGKEYYVSIKDKDTGATKTVAYSNGNKYVSTTDDKGKVTTKFVSNGTYYTVDYDSETVIYNILNVPDLDVSVIDYSNLKFQMVDDSEDGIVEQFKCGSNTEYYYFDSKKNLTNIKIEDRKGDEYNYEIVAFTDEVPSSVFSMPRGFEIKSDSYKLADTRTMTIFSDVINNNAYTMAFTQGDKSAVVVKNGYDFYCSINDTKSNTSSKQLAIGSDMYTFDDAQKTYTKSDRKYDDQCPVFFDTSKYTLEGIEKVTEDKVEYIVETMADTNGKYKFYWQDKTLNKIVMTNSSGKVLDTVVFSTLSAAADTQAFTLPSNYTEVSANAADNNIGLGEGTGEDGSEITAPSDENIAVTLPAIDEQPVEVVDAPTPEETVPEETTPVETAPVIEDTNEVPQTGNKSVIPALFAAVASLGTIIAIKKKKA